MGHILCSLKVTAAARRGGKRTQWLQAAVSRASFGKDGAKGQKMSEGDESTARIVLGGLARSVLHALGAIGTAIRSIEDRS